MAQVTSGEIVRYDWLRRCDCWVLLFRNRPGPDYRMSEENFRLVCFVQKRVTLTL